MEATIIPSQLLGDPGVLQGAALNQAVLCFNDCVNKLKVLLAMGLAALNLPHRQGRELLPYCDLVAD